MAQEKLNIFYEVIRPKDEKFDGNGYGDTLGYQHARLTIFFKRSGETPFYSSEGIEITYQRHKKSDGAISGWYAEQIERMPRGNFGIETTALTELAKLFRRMDAYMRRLNNKGLTFYRDDDELEIRIELLKRIGAVRVEEDLRDRKYHEYPAPFGRSSA